MTGTTTDAEPTGGPERPDQGLGDTADAADATDPSLDAVGADPRPRGALRRLAANAASILGSEVVGRATIFVVYALVSRRLGAFALGQLSLGLSLVYVFQILASAGQRTLMIREIARDPLGVRRQLRSVAVIAVVGSLVSLVPLAVLVAAFRWERSTVVVIGVLFASLVPYALTQVMEGMMQGLEQMRFIAYANIPLHLAKAVAVAVLVLAHASIVAVAAAVAVTYWLVLAAELVIMHRWLIPADADRSRATPWANTRRGASFMGVEIVYAVGSVIPVLVVSGLLGESSVGVVAAANQAVVPLNLAVNSLIAVTFPAMARTFGQGLERTRLVVVNLVEAVLMLVLPFIVTVSLFAPFVTHVLYGNDELDGAASLLRVIVWWAIVNLVATVLGQTLWALDRERTSLVIGLWTGGVSLAGHLLFVKLFGLNGVIAALAATSVVILVQHYRPLASSVPASGLVTALARPALAAAVQVGLILALRRLPTIPVALAGLVVYAAALGAILVVASRGGRRPALTALLHNLTAHDGA